MSTNSDGTANCDRCGVLLPGFGVIYGLVCSHMVGSAVENLIFCYVNDCRTVALDGLVNITASPVEAPVWCVNDGTVLDTRSAETAMLLTDVDPAGDGARYLQLCYVGGCRDDLLLNVGRTP